MRLAVVAPILAVRAGLRSLLASAENEASGLQTGGLQVVFEAASLQDWAAEAPEVDLLVLTEQAASPAALRSLAAALAGSEGRLGLLLLSDDAQAFQGLSGLPLRAWGLLSLDCTAEELRAAAYAVYEGLLVGLPALLSPLFNASTRQHGSREAVLAAADVRESVIEALTERESQVLGLLALGLANKQIAAALVISEHTVKFHISSIYSKLGVANRTEAVRRGVQRGLIVL